MTKSKPSKPQLGRYQQQHRKSGVDRKDCIMQPNLEMSKQNFSGSLKNDKPYPFKHGSQCDRILQYLLSGKSLNNWEIREKFMCLSHTARISELRKHGFHVVGEQISDGVWEYYIPHTFIKQIKEKEKAGVQ